MLYRIYPPIGIARLGNSTTELFIGSETPDSPGTELQANGTETAVTEYKTGDTGNPDTSFQVKRQAARFRLYEFETADAPGRRASLPDGATVEWSVRLVNKKDAVERPSSPPSAPPNAIVVVDGRENRVIDSDARTLSSVNPAAQSLAGAYLGQAVALGELRLDPNGNLLVLGAAGVSRTFENAPIGDDFFNNPGWHDDVADGPVRATIRFADGTEATAEPAWVVVAPPDFAPAVRGIVTLYDTILQAAKTEQLVTLPQQPSFTAHILPLLQRARGLRWVHGDNTWPAVSSNFTQLSNTSNEPAVMTRRKNAVSGILRVETAFSHNDYAFRLRAWQKDYLEQYRTGDFIADFGEAPPPDPLASATLTRAVLDGGVGEGFFPGIEAGIMLTRMSLYTRPFEFRLDHTKLSAGDLTALMAQPWQADFLKCSTGWWPTQRPNVVPGPSPRQEWIRGVIGHQGLVDHVMRLGVVTRRPDQGGLEVQEESGRDRQLPE
jgi:hypothetical protein